MKAGKLKESILKRSILKQLHKRNDDVIVAPAVGGDYVAISVTEDVAVVLSSDPVTLTKEAIGSTNFGEYFELGIQNKVGFYWK